MSTNNVNAPIWEHPGFRSRRAVDLLCREFEDLWHRDDRLSIESFLSKVDTDLHTDLLPELVAAEWELRVLASENPLRADYAARFPQCSEMLTELEKTDFHNPEQSSHPVPIQIPQPGEEFCGYRILKELGRGAMGTVFLAEVPVIGHRIALKILSGNLQHDQIGAARFEREARLLSKLDHPGIVPLYSYGESSGLRYLVMKAIDGVSLSTAIAGETIAGEIVGTIRSVHSVGRLELLRAITRQLANALRAVHDADVLHRDIKPSNILLTDSGQVFLTDFSLARIESAGVDLTLSHEFVGTLRYCVPESLDGTYTKQGDIYSLGLVLFELFSLTTPFGAGTRRELLSRKLSGSVPEMSDRPRCVPEPLFRILCRMTHDNPAERYQSTEEVIEALELSQHVSIKQVVSIRRLLLMSVTLVFVILFIAFGWKMVSNGRATATDVKAVEQNRATSDSRKQTDSIANESDTVSLSEPVSISYVAAQDVEPDLSASGNWLVSERSFDLPDELVASVISISQDGTQLMIVTRSSMVFMGEFVADQLPLVRESHNSEIVGVDQSENGDLAMLVHRDFGRLGHQNEESEATDDGYFVETYSQRRNIWLRVAGPLFQLKTDMPRFIPASVFYSPRSVLIPDATSPYVWNPDIGGSQSVPWPDGPRSAVACFGQYAATAMANGVVIHFMVGQPASAEPLPQKHVMRTTVRNPQSLQYSPSGNSLIVVGDNAAEVISLSNNTLAGTYDISDLQDAKLCFSTDGQWVAFADEHHVRVIDLKSQLQIGEPLDFESPIVLTVPLPEEQMLLTVEKSGRVSLSTLEPGLQSAAYEFQAEDLTAATFREIPRRLLLATEDGRVLSFLIP